MIAPIGRGAEFDEEGGEGDPVGEPEKMVVVTTPPCVARGIPAKSKDGAIIEGVSGVRGRE